MLFLLPRSLRRLSTITWSAMLLKAMFLSASAARGETLLATALTHDVAPTYNSADGLLMITAFANSNATVAATLGQAGNWFGVVNGNSTAIDGTESVTLQLATNASLFQLGHIWTRSRVIISGFASDPGFSDSSGRATGVSYANGALSYFLPWDGGVECKITFTRPEASAGRTLRINVYDTSAAWQATVTRIVYVVNGTTPVVVDLAANGQTMDNFSASDAWSMQNVGLWSEANRTLVADLLFKTNNGIGLSAWRFNLMAGFDPTVSPGTLWQRWRTGNGFLVASNQYDWTRQPGQRWFLSAAKARGIEQFIAMIYSPATNFTRNGRVYGTDGLGSSNLKPGYEAAFAQSVADVLALFKTITVAAEQVAFDYVMPVNEPYWEWNANSQEGSRHSNADIIAQAQALRSALDARSLETEIVLAEAGDLPGLYSVRSDISSEYGATYGNYLTAFNGITNVVSRNLSAHSYFTENPTNQLVSIRQTVREQFATQSHWRYWQTEYCILGAGGPGRDLTMKSALNVARVIWADVAIANASAWHWWLSLSQADYKDGLLYTDFWQPGDVESLYCSKNFWAFGQWSRFIRPGWKRIELAGYDDVFGLMAAAFVDPGSNNVALVFVNHSPASRRIVPAAINLPAGKVVAFWSPWLTSAAPSDNLSPLPPLAPGDECFIPPKSALTLVGRIADLSASSPPIIASLTDQTARAGEMLRLKLDVTAADTPAKLVQVAAYSDNPALLPATITMTEDFVTNTITREVFVNFSGNGLTALAAAPQFPNAPPARHAMSSFEAPQNLGGKYGSRVRGFVVSPQTGNYTFWIASRDASELYLSADENHATKMRIAWVTTATAPRDWQHEANQQSAPIPLVAGRRYYIEAVHVAASGGDHLAVGWQLPDATLERPIPGARLSQWTDPYTNSARHNLVLTLATNATGTSAVSVVATDTLGQTTTNRFQITVAPAISSQPTNLTATVSNGNLILSWPSQHMGWRLDTQTNPLTVGLTDTWTALAGSTQTNIWTTAIDLNNPSVFYRLSLP
jgi:hypothetical protein